MGMTFGDKPVYDAGQAVLECRRHDLPTDQFIGRANAYTCPLGEEPGRGWLLLRRRDVQALDLEKPHDMEVTDGRQRVRLKNLYVRLCTAVLMSHERHDDNLYLVEVWDRRCVLARMPVDAAYNVRSGPGGPFDPDTINQGTGQPWTWDELAGDLWDQVGMLGDYPGLPFLPDGTPEGWVFWAGYAWHALCAVLDRLTCAPRLDPIGDSFSIVRIGEPDPALDNAERRYRPVDLWDEFPVEPDAARLPAAVRVTFLRDPPPPQGLSPYYTTDVPDLDEDSDAVPGTVEVVYDDLTAQGAGDLPDNLGALDSRAAERAADWFRAARSGYARRHRVYAGSLPEPGLVPGARVGTTRWGDRGQRIETEILSGGPPPSLTLNVAAPCCNGAPGGGGGGNNFYNQVVNFTDSTTTVTGGSWTYTNTSVVVTNTSVTYNTATINYVNTTINYVSGTYTYSSTTTVVIDSASYYFNAQTVYVSVVQVWQITQNLTWNFSSTTIWVIQGGLAIYFKVPVKFLGFLFWGYANMDLLGMVVNDYAQGPNPGQVIYRITSSGTLTGIIPKINGDPTACQIIALYSDTPGLVILKHESLLSVPSDRFNLPGSKDMDVYQYEGVVLLYNPVADRWVVVATSTICRQQMSVTHDQNGIMLVGDVLAPGGSYYYGTDDSGAKGYHPLPVTAYTGYWRYDTSTVMADPGAGKLRFNNTTASTTTALAISVTTNGGLDATQWLQALRTGDIIYIQDKGDATKWARYTISGTPTNNTSWFQISVTYTSSAGAGITNNEVLAVTFYMTSGSGGGGTAITVKDEGTTLTTALTSLNFVGTGVTATNVGGDVTVTVPGGGGTGIGPGTVNKIPVWVTSTNIGDSMISQDAGATTVTVFGNLNTQGNITTNAGATVSAGNITSSGVITAAIRFDITGAAGQTMSAGGLSFTGGILTGGSFTGGTVTSVGITPPAAGITVAGSPITTTGSITLTLANDLAALEALTGTNTIYYRSGVDTWSPVTFSGLTFSGGVLTATPSAVTDGDKGDIVVSGGGTVWTIDAGVVSYAKMQTASGGPVLLGNPSVGPGGLAEISVGSGLAVTGTTLQSTITQYTDEMAQDATAAMAAGTARISVVYNDAANTLTFDLNVNTVTAGYLHFSNTTLLAGRSTAGAGPGEEIQIGTGLALSGSVLSCTVTGTVTSVGLTAPAAGITVSGSPVTTSGVMTLSLANDLAALEALSGTNTIYYRSGADAWSAVTIGAGLSFTGGTLTATVSGGTTILSGSGPPTIAVGVVGNYYADTLNNIFYGPRTTSAAEQIIAIAGTPNNQNGDVEFGVKVQFTRSGLITRIRYTRVAASATTLNVKIWNADTSPGTKLVDIADTQAAVDGTFDVTLPTPLAVPAGAIRIISIGSGGAVPFKTGGTTVSNTTDCTFLNFMVPGFLAHDQYPNNVASNGYFVAPVYIPDTTWPITVNQIRQFTSSLGGQVPASGGGTANFLRADGTWAATGTVTSVGLTAPAAGITVSGSPVTSSGTMTLALANDLAALEALSGTNTIYYRSGVDTWSAVTIGTGLAFATGSLALANISAARLLGNASGSSAVPSEVSLSGSLTFIGSTLLLVGDVVSPGASKHYGTDASGTKGWQADLLPATFCEFRLTTQSGVAVSTSDRTAQTTIYFTPAQDSTSMGGSLSGTAGITIYDGASWVLRKTAEVSLSLAGLTASTLYDIFAYWTGAAVSLEVVAWSSSGAGTSTRAVALGLRDGALVKDSDNTRKYVGTVLIAATGQTEDSMQRRYLWNLYNQVRRPMYRTDPSATWNWNTSGWRMANNSNSNLIAFVVGVAGESFMHVELATCTFSATAGLVYAGLADNNVTTPSTSGNLGFFSYSPGGSNSYNPIRITRDWYPSVGLSYLAWMEQTSGAVTATVNNTNGMSGLAAHLDG